MKPSSFFKYVLPDRKDVLQNGMIRFTQPSGLNDPFELFPTITHLTAHAFEAPESIKHSDFTDEDYKFSIARFNRLSVIERDFRERMEKLGVLSLIASSRTNDMPSMTYVDPGDPRMNLTMWSHYAQSHEGFLIEFHAGFIPNLETKEVCYTANRRILTFEEVARGDDSILFEKSPHWAYEHEWRAVLPLDKSDETPKPGVHLFRFDKSKVKSITFGCRAKEELKKEVIEIIRSDETYRHVRFYTARPSKYQHLLEFSEEVYGSDGSCFTNYIPGLSAETIDIQKKPTDTDELSTT